jgi:hypothetical protein
MKNTILKIGVLILFFSLMGGFVLYKMDFFKEEKNEIKQSRRKQILPSSKMGGMIDDSSFRKMIKEEGFEFPEDQYDEEVARRSIIQGTKSLGGNNGLRIQDFIEEENDDTITKLTSEELRILMGSSKSRKAFDSNDFKKAEKELKIKSMMSTSKSVILIEPLPIPKYKVKIPIDTAKKIQIGSSKSIRLIE